MLFEYKFVDLLESLPVPPHQILENLSVSGVCGVHTFSCVCLGSL